MAVVSAATWAILDVNKRFLDRTGFSYDEVIGRRAFELGLWSEEVGLGIRARLSEHGTLEGHEAKITSRGGEELDVLLSGGLVTLESGLAFLVVIRDISSRRRMEVALAESERQYLRLVETASEGVWVIDANERTSFVNNRMAEILGYLPAEMIGTHIHDHMDESGRAIADLNIARRRRGISDEHQFVFRARGGSQVWVVIATRPLMRDDGTYMGSLGMVTDITARKMAEDESRHGRVLTAVLNERARIAQELHDDVAQSFFAIGLEAQRALGAPLRDEALLAQALAAVRSLAEAGGRGIRTAIHALSPDAPADDLESALVALAERFERETGLRCVYTPAGSIVAIAPLEIEMMANAAQELLTNAWKHAHASIAEVRAWEASGSVSISVTDDGNGDAANVRAAAEGSDTYGLPRLNRRLAGLGGELRIARSTGSGLTVTCRLPLRNAP